MAKKLTYSLSVDNDEKAKVLQALLEVFNTGNKDKKRAKNKK